MKKNIYIILLLTMLFLIGCHPDKTEESSVIYPKLLSRQALHQYPAEAFEQGIQGETIVRVLVNKEGKVSEAIILSSSGSDILDEAAMELVRSSVYIPGSIDGVVSDFWLHLPIRFRLGENYELTEDIESWTELTLIYQKQIDSESKNNKSDTYKELFYHYQSLARELGSSRSKKANKYILTVIQKSVGNPWLEYQDNLPLGFLLYEDFIKRYPENEFATMSSSELIKAYQVEIDFLEKKSISTKPYAAIYSLISESLKRLYDQDLK